MRMGEPDIFGHLVHDARKGVLGAAYTFGQRNRRVIARLNDDRAQQIGDAHLRIEFGKHCRAAGGRPTRPPGVFGNEELVLHPEIAGFETVEDHGQGHQLGHGGRLDRVVGILLIEEGAGLVIHQHRVRRAGVEIELG